MRLLVCLPCLVLVGCCTIEGEAPAQVPDGALRCCVSEPFHFLMEKNLDNTRTRFEHYKDLGVGVIRSHAFPASPSPSAAYDQLMKEYDFRIKMILCALPKEEEYQLVDQNGARSRNAVSYWHPDVRGIVRQNTIRTLDSLKDAGLMDHIDYVIPSLGPAGEALYPHPWTTGLPEATFWCYDRYAQEDFRESMQRKYKAVGDANHAWSTQFRSWSDVRVLPPGEQPGPYWRDVLTWYRDTKREFVRWGIDMLQGLCDKRVLLYVPGVRFSQDQWEEAVRTGKGNVWIKIMVDHEFLIDIAAEKGCWLQYTGVDNVDDAAYIAQYIRDKGYNGVRVMGENAGNFDFARDPVRLAETVITNGYVGLDFTHSHFMFEEDGITPNSVFPKLREAFEMIRAADIPGSGQR